MKKSIFAFILFAFSVFVMTSSDQANAKPVKKDYGNCITVVHQGITTTALVLLSFGILPEKVQTSQRTAGHPIIWAIGAELSRHGYSGFNCLQCRKV